MNDRRSAIVGYVRERLVEECTGHRGKQAEIARVTGFTSAHVANVVSRSRGIGDDFAHALAAYWKMTFAELEAAATERARRAPSKAPPPIGQATPMLRHRPEWPDVLVRARDLFPEIEPPFWEMAGDTVLPATAPERVDVAFAGTLAGAYRRVASLPVDASRYAKE